MRLDPNTAWQMKEKLFIAFFGEGQDLSDEAVLNRLFEQEGLSYSPREDATIDDLIQENRMLGFSAVPTFILKDDITITGAQPVDRWVTYLGKILGLS